MHIWSNQLLHHAQLGKAELNGGKLKSQSQESIPLVLNIKVNY